MAASAILANLIGLYPARGFVRPQDSSWNVGKPSEQVYLALDALISEAPEYPATPTQSPVEDATTINDHVQLKPIKLNIHGIVTNSPIGVRAVQNFFSPTPTATTEGGPIAGAEQAIGRADSPAIKAHNWLVNLWKNRIPFDFVGGLGIYKTMVLTNYAPINSAEKGDALQFSATMEQVIVVSTQLLAVYKPAKKISKGAQTPTGVSPQINEPVTNAGDMLKGGIVNPSSTPTAGALSDSTPLNLYLAGLNR